MKITFTISRCEGNRGFVVTTHHGNVMTSIRVYDTIPTLTRMTTQTIARACQSILKPKEVTPQC